MGIFDKGVKKTNRGFFDRLSHAIIGRTEVDDDVLDAIEEALLATDMGVDTTLKIIENLEERVRRDKYVSMGELVDMLREEIADLLDVDKEGLDQIDRELLLTVIQKFQGGPVGLDTLAASIGEDSGTIEDVYEPYLLKNGFIQRTPRGRVVTEKAYAHLGILNENEEK